MAWWKKVGGFFKRSIVGGVKGFFRGGVAGAVSGVAKSLKVASKAKVAQMQAVQTQAVQTQAVSKTNYLLYAGIAVVAVVLIFMLKR